MSTEVADQPGRSRYEIASDGQTAGFLEYERSPGTIAFLHVEVDKQFSGRGLAGTLARHALEQAREDDLRVEPACPFVRDYLIKNPDYLALVDPAQRDRFGL